MRATIVAKKDYADAIQSRTLWALTGVLIVFTTGLVYTLENAKLFGMFWTYMIPFFRGTEIQTLTFTYFWMGPAKILLPLLGLVISYTAIAGEIESGRVKFLLSEPLTRWDVLLGKLIGRTAVITTALVSGLVAAGLFVVLVSDRLEPGSFVGVLLFSVLLAVAYVSIGVNLSAMARTESRALVYVVALYVFMLAAMNFVNNVIYFFLEGSFSPPLVGTSGPPDVDGWWYLINQLTPGGAFDRIVTGISGGEPAYAAAFSDGIPFYLDTSVAVLTLLFWVVAPVTAGYVWFQRADIA